MSKTNVSTHQASSVDILMLTDWKQIQREYTIRTEKKHLFGCILGTTNIQATIWKKASFKIWKIFYHFCSHVGKANTHRHTLVHIFRCSISPRGKGMWEVSRITKLKEKEEHFVWCSCSDSLASVFLLQGVGVWEGVWFQREESLPFCWGDLSKTSWQKLKPFSTVNTINSESDEERLLLVMAQNSR